MIKLTIVICNLAAVRKFKIQRLTIMAYQYMFKVQVDPVRIEDVLNHIDEYALLFPCAKFKVVCPFIIG